MTEDELIAACFAPIAGPGALALRDDAALYQPPPGSELVVTVDAVVAGVHFFPSDPPASIARKALRVNVSDLAAKGAEPQGFLLTLALPLGLDESWIRAFASALGEDAALWRCPLLGGDTVSTPGPLSLSVTAFGAVPAGRMVRRTGAQPGDMIYVSGTIGDAALGLYLQRGDEPDWAHSLDAVAKAHLVHRYLEPQPRLALAPVVRDFAHGSMDVSDGLVGDLEKMMRVSGCAARVELANVPLSEAGRAACKDAKAFETALTGGDDYEIVCTVPKARAHDFEESARATGISVTAIGEVLDGQGVAFIDRNGLAARFSRRSYTHFAE